MIAGGFYPRELPYDEKVLILRHRLQQEKEFTDELMLEVVKLRNKIKNIKRKLRKIK